MDLLKFAGKKAKMHRDNGENARADKIEAAIAKVKEIDP
jgi:hypothetical protein